jgi:tetratricopeptide (TPR) repeat protein
MTGRPPFRAAGVLETLEQVRTCEPLAPRSLNPGCPRDLQTICLKCLEKEPTRRYASAGELADDLGRFLRGEPIRARPVSRLERLAKWARRKPALAALAGVSVLALAGLVAGAAVYERRLRAALVETAAERERADANYRQARDTVQQLLGQVNARSSAGIPKLEELRRQQQESALTFFLKMAEQQGDDPEARLDAAWAHHQAGLLQLMLGRPEEATVNLRRAEERFAALVAQFPQRGRYRFHHAHTLKTLGGMGHLPPAEGEDCLRRALALAEGLVREDPSSVPYLSAEADIRITLGSFLWNHNKRAEAEDHYRRAVALYEDLRREQPEAASHRLVLAKAYLNLTNVLQNTKRSPHEFHARAEALLEQLHGERPEDNEIRESLAVLRVNWAYMQMAEGKREAALADLAKNVQMLEEALRREPSHAGLRDCLLRTHGVRGQVYEGQKRFAEAAAEYGRQVELSPSPEAADFRRLFLALAYARAGQHTRADQVLEDWKTRATLDAPPEQLLHCSTVYCTNLAAVRSDSQLPSAEREALVERYGSRAVAFLGKLHERGYFKDPSRAAALRTEEDFRLLHGRDDFKKLLEQVGKAPG